MARNGDGRLFAIGLSLLVAVLSASTSPWWWDRVFGEDDDFVGGCETFHLFAQNEFDPLGTKISEAPMPSAESFRGFSPNERVAVDGWVRTRSPYPSNSPPWDSDVWFHLANNAGWVTFAGVRANPTDPSTSGNFGEGTSPAPTDSDCAGTFRT